MKRQFFAYLVLGLFACENAQADGADCDTKLQAALANVFTTQSLIMRSAFQFNDGQQQLQRVEFVPPDRLKWQTTISEEPDTPTEKLLALIAGSTFMTTPVTVMGKERFIGGRKDETPEASGKTMFEIMETTLLQQHLIVATRCDGNGFDVEYDQVAQDRQLFSSFAAFNEARATAAKNMGEDFQQLPKGKALLDEKGRVVKVSVELKEKPRGGALYKSLNWTFEYDEKLKIDRP
jgi:hypothetical protein